MNTAKMGLNVLMDLMKIFIKIGFFNKLFVIGLVNLILFTTGLFILIKNKKKKNAPIRVQ